MLNLFFVFKDLGTVPNNVPLSVPAQQLSWHCPHSFDPAAAQTAETERAQKALARSRAIVRAALRYCEMHHEDVPVVSRAFIN